MYTQNTVLRELVLIIKQLYEEQKISDMTAQRYANGFRLFTYLLQKQGKFNPLQYHLFKVVQFENEPSLVPSIEEFVQFSFKIIQQNEETYYKQSKLILTNDEFQFQMLKLMFLMDQMIWNIKLILKIQILKLIGKVIWQWLFMVS